MPFRLFTGSSHYFFGTKLKPRSVDTDGFKYFQPSNSIPHEDLMLYCDCVISAVGTVYLHESEQLDENVNF